MFGTCSVDVQYLSGVLPNMYRTCSEDLADKDRRDNGARLGPGYGTIGDVYEMYMESV